MKDNRELVNIFEECLERILTGGETVEQCLAGYPEYAAELAPLLQTALEAKETLEIAPSPEFREKARYQILTELRDIEERKQRRFSFFGWQPRWATAAIAVLVLLVASSGTVAAAGNSLPDQTLYPVKLATERVRLALTPSALGKAEYYAELVDKRVNEIISMVEKGKLQHMEETAERLNNQLMAMTLLVGTEDVEAVVPAVSPEEPKPGVMMAPPPPEAATQAPPTAKAGEPQKGKPAITVAPAQLVPEKAPVLAPAPAAIPEPEVEVEEEEGDEMLDERAKLIRIIVQNAKKHSAALRAALQRAPESARPALLQALESSNIEYEKLLQLLEEAEAEDENEDKDNGKAEDKGRE
ncbi:MAG: hypothetical protein HQ577_05295 [Dehalococcoidia bacterium]|nr:hypothetical protein [Dehalococcoidia bacterium]